MLLVIEKNKDIEDSFNNFSNKKDDNAIKLKQLESISNTLKKENSSIFVESFYIYDSTNSFLQRENEGKEKELFNPNENKEFKILKFMKIIGNHKISAEFVKEIHSFIISGGADNKLIIYSPNFVKIREKSFKDKVYNIYEKKK